MRPMQHTALLGVTEAAEHLGCSVATVKRLARAGQLVPAHKLPGQTGAYLFRLRDVERIAQKRAAA